jgi:hypothetical protein
VIIPTGSKYQNPQLHLGNSGIMLDFSELPQLYVMTASIVALFSHAPGTESAFSVSSEWDEMQRQQERKNTQMVGELASALVFPTNQQRSCVIGRARNRGRPMSSFLESVGYTRIFGLLSYWTTN